VWVATQPCNTAIGLVRAHTPLLKGVDNVRLATVSYFLPTVRGTLDGFLTADVKLIKDLGFSCINAQGLTVAPYIVGWFMVIFQSWHSDHTEDRGSHIMYRVYTILAAVAHKSIRCCIYRLVSCCWGEIIVCSHSWCKCPVNPTLQSSWMIIGVGPRTYSHPGCWEPCELTLIPWFQRCFWTNAVPRPKHILTHSVKDTRYSSFRSPLDDYEGAWTESREVSRGWPRRFKCKRSFDDLVVLWDVRKGGDLRARTNIHQERRTRLLSSGYRAEIQW